MVQQHRDRAVYSAAQTAPPSEPWHLTAGLVGISAYLLLACTTGVLAVINIGHPPDHLWSLIGRTGRSVLEDVSWFLPTLFGALVSAAGLLVAQTLANSGQPDMQRAHRLLALLGQVIAGTAVAGWALAVAGAVGSPAKSGHLWAATVTTLALVAAAIGLSHFVFGPPGEQLRSVRWDMREESVRQTRLLRQLREDDRGVFLRSLPLAATVVGSTALSFALLLAGGHPSQGSVWPLAAVGLPLAFGVSLVSTAAACPILVIP